MRRLLIPLLAVLFAIPAGAQVTGPASTIRFGASLPAACSSTGNNVFFKTAATAGLYVCKTANTWTLLAAGSGSGTVTNAAALTLSRVVLGAGGDAVSVLGSLGTTTTLLHGNASGAPTFAAVVSGDMNITTTSCTRQFVTAISSGGVGSCTSLPFPAVWSLPGAPAGLTNYPFFVASEAVVFPDDFAGSVCHVLANPTAGWEPIIKKNGSSVGAVIIATDGTCTFSTTGGALSLSIGDYLTIDTPAADATLDGVMLNFLGTRG